MISLLLAGALPAVGAADAPECDARGRKEPDKPNIILIMTDQQWGGAMSCAGNPYVHTPGMDRLAERGVRYDNAYCAMPLSGPSRGSMMTGLLPCQGSVMENEKPLPAELADCTLGDVVRSAGYDCAYAGKWHVNTISLPSERAFGFDRIAPVEPVGCADLEQNPVTAACVEYMRRDHDKPFFLVASYLNPHNICEFARGQRTPHANIPVPACVEACPPLPANFAVGEGDPKILAYEKGLSYAMYPSVDFTDEDWRAYLYAYYRLVEDVDRQIGLLVDEMDRQGLWKNTVVVFMSDHGDGAAAHHWNQKTALWEEVANVPFIVCLPEDGAGSGAGRGAGSAVGNGAGRVSHTLVNAGIDIMPTFAAIAGAQMPAGRSGESLVNCRGGVLSLNPEANSDYIITETNFKQTSGTYGFMVRTADYKYVIYDKGKGREQLFDMRSDRLEMNNLAGDEKYAQVLSQHRRILWEWVNAQKLKEAARIRKFLMLP